MGKTKIQWSDMTWPVVSGCSPVSEGCRMCYAARMAATRLQLHQRYAGLATFSDGKAKWTGEVRLNHDVLEQPLHWKKPRRIFVASMSDLFHPDVPAGFIYDVFKIMCKTPQHTFQVLTKRPHRMRDFVYAWSGGQIFAKASFAKLHPNIHLGVSVENQAAADERREYLRQCPAAVKFVSYEPALGPVDWTGWEFASQIISGGESGPGARRSHPNWHRATLDFCQENDIAYFMKQWGRWLPLSQASQRLVDSYPAPKEFYDVGKKAAGHMLDGRTWQEFPVSTRVSA